MEESPNNPIDNEDVERNGSYMTLQLGDIIQIYAPFNPDLDEQSFLLSYLDSTIITMINVVNFERKVLNIESTCALSDESITKIIIVSHADEKGYARQNGLVPKTWIDIHFGGDFPTIITGEITNLEEDKIDITTYPSISTIYIDFGYKGIPRDLPIETIVIRDKPAGADKIVQDVDSVPEECIIPEAEATIEYIETGESIITIPESASPNENLDDVLRTKYLDAADLFGEELQEIVLEVEVPENQKRFGLDAQTNDLMDHLLSTIPIHKRTKAVMDNIHMNIQRFVELRKQFSQFDANGNVIDALTTLPTHKPLVNCIENLSTQIPWIVPVVDQRKKLYEPPKESQATDPANYVEDGIYINVKSDIDEMVSLQKNESLHDDKYARYYQSMSDYMAPFESNELPGSHLVEKPVAANMDTVVSSFDDYYSTTRKVIPGGRFIPSKYIDKRSQFVIQRYNLGMNVSTVQTTSRNGVRVYHKKSLMPDDTMAVKSLIMLPEPVMEYSRAKLSSTNIMKRAELSQSFLQLTRLLRKSETIDDYVLETLEKEVDYREPVSDAEKEKTLTENEKRDFLKTIVSFSLDETLHREPHRFHKMLECIIPNTRHLIKHMQKHVNGSLSVHHLIEHLEPFMVCPEDITYGQYNEMRFFMKNRIKEYKGNYAKTAPSFAKLTELSKMTKPYSNIVQQMFGSEQEITKSLLDHYSMLEKYTNGEMLNQFIEADSNTLFYTYISKLLLSLITPNRLFDSIMEIKDMGENDHIKPNYCTTRVLAKKYTSLDELKNDNNKDELYFDKEYDETPYSVLKKYADKQKSMSPADFVDYLAENLMQKHDAHPDNAPELAKIMIAGKKPVLEGHYAIVEIEKEMPKASKSDDESVKETIDKLYHRTETLYYKRIKDNWVEDKTIDTEAFMDTQALFCNSAPDCYKAKDKSCESVDDAHKNMNRISRDKVMKELDKRFAMSMEDVEKDLETKLTRSSAFLKKIMFLKKIQLEKPNHLAYTIGTQFQAEDRIISPYARVFTLILGQSDFIKKQANICKLAEEYCREPMVQELKEDAHWLYCKETNTKLVPLSIYQLAKAFVRGDDYLMVLDGLCRSVGIASDDGDAIVDKHSGYILRKLDFIAEDEYDDAGFKITSHSIIEKDMGTVISETLAKERRIFTNQDDQHIYNVFMALCQNAALDPTSIEELVLRLSLELFKNRSVVMEEAKYVMKMEEAFKTTKKMGPDYETYRGQALIAIVGAATLIAIQSLVPSIVVRKTYPGCVMSFKGYPLEGGTEDTTGIKYIACVLNGTKSDEQPWKSITKLNTVALTGRIKDVIDKHMMKRNDVQDLLSQKREYLILVPDQEVPDDHSIKKWTQFLPPVVPINVIASLRGITSEYKSELMDILKKGHKSQHEHINVLKTKIQSHAFGIIERINHVVSKKDALLQTASHKPYLENACCNELDKKHESVIHYFAKDEPEIVNYVRIANDAAKLLRHIHKISKPYIIYHKENTVVPMPPIPEGVIEDNIYAAFIHYGRYDKDLPVPSEYRVVCGERPPKYQIHASLAEKKDFLKANGRRFGRAELDQLMNIVREKNSSSIDLSKKVNPVLVLNDFLDSLEQRNSEVVPLPLRSLLRKAMDVYRPHEMKKVRSVPEITDLRKYLKNSNQSMLREIVDFIQSQGNLENRTLNDLTTFLNTMDAWKENNIYTSTQYLKNMMENIAKVYPSIVLHEEKEDRRVHKHWGLSQYHQTDIHTILYRFYEELNKFKQDTTMNVLLQKIRAKTADLYLLLKYIPLESEIHKNDSDYFALFDKTSLLQLHIYCVLSVLYEYIGGVSDDDIAEFEMTEVNNERSERNRESVSDRYMGATPLVDVDAVDEAEQLQQIELQEIDRDSLMKRACSFMTTCLKIEYKTKQLLDKTYSEISRNVRRAKQIEKKGITDYLGNMSKDQRKVENMLKQYKLGRWNVGIQKGIFAYDKNTYNNERKAGIARLNEDMETEYNPLMNVEPESYDVEDLERDAMVAANREGDMEAYDIGGLTEDYTDGDYYGDFGDENFSDE